MFVGRRLEAARVRLENYYCRRYSRSSLLTFSAPTLAIITIAVVVVAAAAVIIVGLKNH